MYEHGDRIHLVGGLNPSEKYEFVSWGYYSQYVESHKIPWFQTTNQSWRSQLGRASCHLAS